MDALFLICMHVVSLNWINVGSSSISEYSFISSSSVHAAFETISYQIANSSILSSVDFTSLGYLVSVYIEYILLSTSFSSPSTPKIQNLSALQLCIQLSLSSFQVVNDTAESSFRHSHQMLRKNFYWHNYRNYMK